MRMLPVALATLGDPDLLEAQAVAQGRLTHHHPLSDAACRLVGRLLHRAVGSGSPDQLRRVADEAAAACPAFRFQPYRGISSGYVVDTVQTVLHHLFATSSFEECLVSTVNRGGDADTAGAIAGAIAGALYGPGAIPRRWSRRLPGALSAELCDLADALVHLSRAGRGAPPRWP
jgi:ADP-ribosyl-[dinitrogen reductase] hydrolase